MPTRHQLPNDERCLAFRMIDDARCVPECRDTIISILGLTDFLLFVFQFIKILHIYEETVFLNAVVDTRKLELLLDMISRHHLSLLSLLIYIIRLLLLLRRTKRS